MRAAAEWEVATAVAAAAVEMAVAATEAEATAVDAANVGNANGQYESQAGGQENQHT